MEKTIFMSKYSKTGKKYLTLIVVFILFLIVGCDGTSSTRELTLKSEVDNHTTIIKLKTKVKGFNPGDILHPELGKATFTTPVRITIDSLFDEITKENNTLEVELFSNDYIIIYEPGNNGNVYSYFIRFVELKGNENYFQIGELRLFTKVSEESKFFLFPFHLIDDQTFTKEYLENPADLISGLTSYKIKADIELADFIEYYNTTGWFEIEQTDNEVVVKKTFTNENFIDEYIFEFNIQEHTFIFLSFQ